MPRAVAAAGVLLALALPVRAGGSGDAAFFENQVRPLLARACFKCHGPKKQEAGLRLDGRAALLRGGEHGPAVVPGNPDASLLIRAVRHQGELKMPPGRPLPADHAAVLERWVRGGAGWPADAPAVAVRGGPPTAAERQFWSFQPVADPPVPAVRDTAWPRTAVDCFILARLEAEGLRPAPPADRRTLLRRATFDLTGLPPTPEDVDAFLADNSPDAFARVVDRLLASPAYGERWGRHWLDVVRYADTAGETADYPVPEAYRYRNYVIDAFNRDMPYDEFVREQVAGDILARRGPPERYAERVTATGYLAISRRFGFDTEKYDYLTIQDTIDTLGQSFLGLTLGCARCHDHKFDPVSMADYYALYGIFAGTRYAFPGSERLQQVRALVPLVPPAEADRRWAAFDRAVGDCERECARLGAGGNAVVIRPLADLDGDFELQAAPMGGSRGFPSSPWVYTGETSVTTAQSPHTNLYRTGVNGIHFPAGAAESSLGQGLSPAWTAAAGARLYFNIDFRTGGTGSGSHRLYLGHGPGAEPAVEVFLGPTLAVRSGGTVETIRSLRPNTWYNLRLALDLRRQTFSGFVGVPGDVAAFGGKALATGWRGRIDYLLIDGKGPAAGPRPALDIDNIGLRTTPIPAPVAALAVTKAAANLPPTELAKRRADARRRLEVQIEQGPYPMAYAVAEGTPQDVRIQIRGEPERPGARVPRRFLEVLGGDPVPGDAEGSGRLELAGWLTRPSNPLTARVMVNRIWQHHFGTGLVATENDFGTRGQRPTHPELLDFLARRFVEGGWSVKALHRLIMMSATYRQAAGGGNLLAGFPRRRLDAEAVRDAMLAVSGRLDRSPGGRHPFPPVSQCRFTQHNPFIAVYDTNRRSVYLMTQRIKRHPFLALFDGADPNASTARRTPTTVPTQSLFLMNDPFVHEQAAGLARRVRTARADDAGRLDLAFRLTLARPPTPAEVGEAVAFLAEYRDQLATAGVPAAEHEVQCWAALARTLLARNEFLFID